MIAIRSMIFILITALGGEKTYAVRLKASRAPITPAGITVSSDETKRQGFGTGGPYQAIDGDNGTIFHSSKDFPPWLIVDLGGTFNVGGVAVVNRHGKLGHRTQGAQIDLCGIVGCFQLPLSTATLPAENLETYYVPFQPAVAGVKAVKMIGAEDHINIAEIIVLPESAPPTGAGTAFGDPHVMNIFGTKFDILQPGNHTLVLFPSGAAPGSALLEVRGRITPRGPLCKGQLYLTDVAVTGQLLGTVGDLEFSTTTEEFNTPKTIGLKAGSPSNISVQDFIRAVPPKMVEVSVFTPAQPSNLNGHATTLTVKLLVGE